MHRRHRISTVALPLWLGVETIQAGDPPAFILVQHGTLLALWAQT